MENDIDSLVMKAFGKAIKIKRVEIGMTQESLAAQALLARSFVSGVERGSVKATIVSVWKLASALQCQPSELWSIAQNMISAN